MKINYSDFKQLLPGLDWSPQELAEKLSTIGHETEISADGQLDISLTTNRRDCRDLLYLVYDLAGVYNLITKTDLIKFGHKEAIAVTAEQINRLLGSNINSRALKSLKRLGFDVTDTTVAPPDFRDVTTVADVAEEIVRQIGYDHLNIQLLSKQDDRLSISYSERYNRELYEVYPTDSSERNNRELYEVYPTDYGLRDTDSRSGRTGHYSERYNRELYEVYPTDYKHILEIKFALAKIGLVETLTSSFDHDGVIEVIDPFSRDEPFLRSNLLTGLLKTVAANPYLKKAAFFEIGVVFTPSEVTKLGLIIAGFKDLNFWQTKISQAIGQPIHFSAIEPAKAASLDVKQNHLSYLELPVEKLQPTPTDYPTSLERSLPKYKTISKFPPLVRDLTIDQKEGQDDHPFDQLKDRQDLLLAEVIDQYHDPVSKRRSVTYRLIFQKLTSSYTEDEIKTIDKELKTFSEPLITR